MDALNEVYLMYWWNPYDETWKLHNMSAVEVYETFEQAKQIPENRTGRTDWREISPYRWQLDHYWIEKATIQYAVSPSTREFLDGMSK